MSDYYRCDYCKTLVHVDDDNHGWQDADSDERGVCAKCIKSATTRRAGGLMKAPRGGQRSE
jgi:hypothetical protein